MTSPAKTRLSCPFHPFKTTNGLNGLMKWTKKDGAGMNKNP